MKIHAIRTGSVRIKHAQVERQGRGFMAQLAIFADREWTDWVPTFAWAIEHRDGVIVVDTGQGAHLKESPRSPRHCCWTTTQFAIGIGPMSEVASRG